jgi:hypothetical protein
MVMMLSSPPGGTSDGLAGQNSVECARQTPVSPGQQDDQDDGDDVHRLKRYENEIDDFECVRKDQEARQKPDLPGDDADSGRAMLPGEVSDLRQVPDHYGDRSEKTQNLRDLLHQSEAPAFSMRAYTYSSQFHTPETGLG